jgi:hypothetical protein
MNPFFCPAEKKFRRTKCFHSRTHQAARSSPKTFLKASAQTNKNFSVRSIQNAPAFCRGTVAAAHPRTATLFLSPKARSPPVLSSRHLFDGLLSQKFPSRPLKFTNLTANGRREADGEGGILSRLSLAGLKQSNLRAGRRQGPEKAATSFGFWEKNLPDFKFWGLLPVPK